MATLSSGYRDGTSEAAKRHARMRRADLRLRERVHPMPSLGCLRVTWLNTGDRTPNTVGTHWDTLVDTYVTFKDSDGDAMIAGFAANPTAGPVLADWIEEREGWLAEESPAVFAAVLDILRRGTE